MRGSNQNNFQPRSSTISSPSERPLHISCKLAFIAARKTPLIKIGMVFITIALTSNTSSNDTASKLLNPADMDRG